MCLAKAVAARAQSAKHGTRTKTDQLPGEHWQHGKCCLLQQQLFGQGSQWAGSLLHPLPRPSRDGQPWLRCALRPRPFVALAHTCKDFEQALGQRAAHPPVRRGACSACMVRDACFDSMVDRAHGPHAVELCGGWRLAAWFVDGGAPGCALMRRQVLAVLAVRPPAMPGGTRDQAATGRRTRWLLPGWMGSSSVAGWAAWAQWGSSWATSL